MSIFKQIRSILGRSNSPATLPENASKAPVPAGPIERRSRKRLSSHEGRRILIIDDSPTILAALKKMLQSAGCKTREAIDAKSGLDLISKGLPDLIFLDIVLPGMSGFTALRMLRRDPLTQHIPIIMISGNEQATEQFYVKRIGADDFMKKPFSRFEVFARMDSLVEANKLPRLKPSSSNDNRVEKPADKLNTGDQPASGQPATPASAMGATSTQAPSPPPAKPTAPVKPVVHEEAKPAAPVPAAMPPLTPIAISTPDISALEARKRLTEMGLTYYDQEQFVAAIARGDKLALELFIAGGGVDINV